MLVSIPRLMVYASILLAAKNIPDLATSQQGFEAIQLASFATLEGILLKSALAIMALSTVVHGLHLIRIVLAGAVCTFSLCYLGSMRKAMTIDLESRYVLFTVPMNAHEMKDSNLRTRPSRLGLLSCSSSYVYLTTLTPGPLACACITQQNHKSRRFNKLSRAQRKPNISKWPINKERQENAIARTGTATAQHERQCIPTRQQHHHQLCEREKSRWTSSASVGARSKQWSPPLSRSPERILSN